MKSSYIALISRIKVRQEISKKLLRSKLQRRWPEQFIVFLQIKVRNLKTLYDILGKYKICGRNYSLSNATINQEVLVKKVYVQPK